MTTEVHPPAPGFGATSPVQVRPIADGERTELIRTAMADGHAPLIPTHVWTRDGKIVGYASVGAVCVLSGWAHSKEMTDAEALHVLRFAQDEAERQGANVLMIPSTPDCRFTPWIAADRAWVPTWQPITCYMRKV